jgi:hypothetical protein
MRVVQPNWPNGILGGYGGGGVTGDRIVAGAINVLYMATILKDTPVAYWRLDDAGITASDLSGNGNPGTLNGGVTTGVAGAILSDPSDHGMSLDGATGYISVPTAAVLHPGDTFSLECWFKYAAGNVTLIVGGVGDYNIAVNGNGALLFQKDFTAVLAVSANGYNDGAWHHAVWAKAGVGNAFYIDGGPIYPSVTNATIVASSHAIILGAETDLSVKLAGSLDEVAIYSYALTAAQVLKHYQVAKGL